MSDKKTRAPHGKIRITINEDETHRTLWKAKASPRHLVLMSLAALILLGVFFWFVIAYTPLRTLIPGYPDARSRKAAIENALRIDSLETSISRWYLYAEDLRRVLSGEPSMGIDSITRIAARPVPAGVAAQDSLLRADVVQEEQFGLSPARRRDLPIEAMAFYTPVKGVVSKGFDRNLHPWVDVTAPVGSPVMAVLDGSVVYTSWSQDNGYTLVLQHGSDLLSIYKNNQKLLHKTGDVVKAGTPVAMLASSTSLTKGDHLHFELWYKGVAVDPAQYIKF